MPYTTFHVSMPVLCQFVVFSWDFVLCSRWVFWHFSWHILPPPLQWPILIHMDAAAVGKNVSVAWESYRKYGQSELWEVLSTTSPILPPFLQLSCFSPNSMSTENGGNTFLQNTGTLIHNTVQKPKRRPSTDILDHYYYFGCFCCCCHCPSERMFVTKAATVDCVYLWPGNAWTNWPLPSVLQYSYTKNQLNLTLSNAVVTTNINMSVETTQLHNLL